MRQRPATNSRGFTLVELMTVVALVAVLATLASYGVGKYIRSSQSSEAIQMLGSIKAAQEQYKAETFTYKDVSGSHSLASSSFYPMTTPSTKRYMWGDVSTNQGKAWRELGITTDTPVRFAYGCAAGGATDAVPAAGTSFAISNWPATLALPWYVVRATGDLDGDSELSVYVSSSFTGEIFIDKEGE